MTRRDMRIACTILATVAGVCTMLGGYLGATWALRDVELTDLR